MPSPRVQSFMDNHVRKDFSKDGYVKPLYLSILRSRAITKVWQETEGEATTIRKAKAISEYLEELPIFIRPDELIVGFYAEDPHAFPISIEAIDPNTVKTMMADGNTKPEHNSEWEEIMKYWEKRGLNNLVKNRLTEKELELAKAENSYMEVLPTQYTSRAQAEYELALENGLNGLVELLQSKYDALYAERDDCGDGSQMIEINKKMTDLKAMLMSCEAVIRWARRYSKLAAEMAEQEKDPERKKQLEEIAARCDYVPANPARTFLEALQSYWFCFLVAHMIEYLSHGTSQRLDVAFWPWYKKDVVEDKTLSRQEALDIVEEFLLKIDEMGRPLPLVRRKALQGSNFLATYTIGGVLADGSDACNELTMVILDALDDMRISHPDFKFRWHPKVNPEVYRRVLEVVRLGLGQPSIKNDEVVIDTLTKHYGFTLEEARSWAVVGCISPGPTINWGRARRDAWAIRPAKCLELTLFGGTDPLNGKPLGPQTPVATAFKTFEDLFEAFRQHIEYVMKLSARIKAITEDCEDELCKRPFLSVLYRRSLNACRDIMDAPDKGMAWVNDPTKIDATDSLIAIKKLVYDDKKYSMDELLTALKADWVGYEAMREEFINAPKFGNNDVYADTVAKQVMDMIAHEMSKVKDKLGSSPMPSGLIVTWMFELADKIGALPNGRKHGDPLADGGINPHAGYDKNGPMAAMLSATKIDHRKQKANIFNQKFTPNCLEGEAGLQKFQDYVTSSLALGLDMIQFNVIDAQKLKAAQEEPDKHKDLVIRISGYNARFVELDKFVQDAVITRTEHTL